MNSITLKNSLLSNLSSFPSTELVARQMWASSYETFVSEATSQGVTITNSFGPATSSMVSAMASSWQTDSSVALQAGITAFWTTILGAYASFWPSALAMTIPASLTGLSSALRAVFTSNCQSSLSQADCMTNISSVIATCSLGGTVTWPGSPPVVFPII